MRSERRRHGLAVAGVALATPAGKTPRYLTEEWMQDVVNFDVLPMLAEYWFDDTDKLQRWENILHGVFQ